MPVPLVLGTCGGTLIALSATMFAALRRIAVVGMGAFALLTGSACGLLGSNCPPQECDAEDPNVIYVCAADTTEELVWAKCAADELCVETSDGALCSSSAEPAEECAPFGEGRSPSAVCVDGKPSICLAGYPTQSEPCIGTCVDTVACGARCAVDPVADHEACSQPNTISLCVGNTAVTCGCGEAPSERECDDFCVFAPANSVAPGEAICAQSDVPDPSCPNVRGGAVSNNSYCDGNTRVECERGYAIGRTACVTCTQSEYAFTICDM